MNRYLRINFLSTSVLAAAVIGAGIFSLPFVFVSAGLLKGILYLVIATIAVTAGHLFYADLVVKSGVHHNFVNYSKRYLGEVGYLLSILISVVQTLLVLVIYLILSQSFFNLILDYTSFFNLILFWLLGSAAIFTTLSRFVSIEALMVGGITAIIGLIFLVASPFLPEVNFTNHLFSDGFLIAMGPLLFSLSGREGIVELVRYAKKPALIKRSVILGTVIPAIAYVLFVLAIIALSPKVTEDAVSGLVGVLSPFLLAAIGVLGLLSILSSYVAIGFDVNDILKFDLKWQMPARLATIAGVPLALYLVGFQNFIQLISFTGGVFGALTFIFIVLMWMVATKKRPISAIALLLFFFIVLVDQISRFV